MIRLRSADLTVVRPALAVAAVAIGAFGCAEPDAFTAPEAVAALTKGPNEPCTVDQGQELIDGGQYQAAIQKFTCLIGLDPSLTALQCSAAMTTSSTTRASSGLRRRRERIGCG